MKRRFLTLVLCFIILMPFVLAACDEGKEQFTPPEMKEYSLTEGSGSHVSDIDYDEYLTKEGIGFGDKRIFDIRDYGASVNADAKTNTTAINETLKAASQEQGVVLVQGGTYITGTVYMQSDVTLYVADSSALKLPDYDSLTADEKRQILANTLIRAQDVDNWVITGPGTLDGNGTDYTLEAEDPTKNYAQANFNLKEKVLQYRARLRNRKSEEFGCHIIYAYGCNNISVNNIKIYEPSTWTVKIENCDGAKFRDVVIDNNIYVANSDGIDVCSSSNVDIEHCFIATGDDGIVLKSTSGEIKNVTVKDCEIMSLANNFKIGTETGYDVSNVTVEDCYFFAAEIAGGYTGIAIESADGADVSDITVRNINMNNVPSALLIWLGCRLDKNKGSDGTMGSVSGITVENIYAKNVDIASAVVGCEYEGQLYPVKDVTLRNFHIEYRECDEDLNIYKGDDVKHTNMNGYPEITRVSHMYFISHELSEYYDLPVYGLYAYTVEGMVVENFNVTPRSVNTRPFTNIGTFDQRDNISAVTVN